MNYNTSDDIIMHLGDDYGEFHGAIVPPIYQNTLFVEPTKEYGVGQHPYGYTRISNPTTEVLEKKLAAIEGGSNALCFSSGMAAITSAIIHFIEKDCHIITVKSIYNPVREFFEEFLTKKFGAEVTYLDGWEMEEVEKYITDKTKLIYLESPSSAIYKIQDLEKVGLVGKKYKIGTVIDNTYATPLYQKPLSYGIDISVHTATKYIGGHSDVVGGVLISSEEICSAIQFGERAVLGGCIDPHQAWLLLRGLRTMPIRLKQHAENALKAAKYLEHHEKIEKVYYPGLASHPQKELIDKQLHGFNGLISIVPKGTAEEVTRFMDGLRYFMKGCSWGGFESLVCGITVGKEDAYCEMVDCPRNLVRLHIGLENAEMLIADLEQALDKM